MLSQYVTAFNYINKNLIVLSATTRGVCIVSHATAISAPVGIVSAGGTTIFTLAKGIMKKLLSTKRNKKKKHDNSKFNIVETLVCQALINIEVSPEEFITILKDKDKYEKIKENVRNVSEKLEEKQENKKLNSINSSN